MPRYFIHLDNGHGFIRDEEGRQYPDFDAARRGAIMSGAQIIGEELGKMTTDVKLTLYIEDADHSPVETVPMTATIHSRQQR